MCRKDTFQSASIHILLPKSPQSSSTEIESIGNRKLCLHLLPSLHNAHTGYWDIPRMEVSYYLYYTLPNRMCTNKMTVKSLTEPISVFEHSQPVLPFLVIFKAKRINRTINIQSGISANPQFSAKVGTYRSPTQ